MNIKLAASMMCANYANLAEDVRAIDNAEIDFLHCDVMDGHYVPNLVVGPDYLKTLRRISKTKLDIHLMVEKPEYFIDMFDLQKGERICFHPETTRHSHRLLTHLKQSGLEIGIALSPSVPIDVIEDILYEIDFIHVMMVNPGFAGQPLIPAMMKRLKKLRDLLNSKNIEIDIEADGCVSFDNTPEFIKNGATTLVLGAYSCFLRELGISEAIGKVKRIVASSLKH